jgi:AsmA protein
MRILLRVTAVVVLLLVAAVVTAALILPGVIDSEEFRGRVGVAAEDALGREVRYGTIGLGLFPPSVVVEEVAVAGESADLPLLLEARRLELRASLLPLLARTLVVDSRAAAVAGIKPRCGCGHTSQPFGDTRSEDCRRG